MVALADNHPANAPARRGNAVIRKPLLFRLIGLLAGSLILSVIIEWVGMSTLWKDEGQLHSQRMLTNELTYLNDDFREGVLGSSPAEKISTLAGKGYYYLFQWTRIEALFSWTGQRTGLNEYSNAMVSVVQVFFIRVGILTFSLPIFILFSIVGVASGLTLRDIRRWSGGREFGGIYHRAKWIAPKALITAWVVYLAMPFSVHPNLVILPCAVLFGMNLMIITSTFKKYL